MDRYTKYLMTIAVIVLALAAVGDVRAQSIILPSAVEAVSGISNADDTDVALLIRFVGPSTGTTTTMNSGTVEVEADTDMVFLSGAQGAEAADTSLECPVSGALGGIVDVDDAACDTLGEICDIINAPSSNFRCVILDGHRTQVANDRILDTNAARATTLDGAPVYWDTSTAFDSFRAVVPAEYRSMRQYLPQGSRTLKHDQWNNTRTVALLANSLATYASGTSTLKLLSINVSDLSLGKTGEVVTEVYSEANGATTVAKTYSLGAPVGVPGRKNEKMLAMLDNSAALSVYYARVFGYLQRLGPP